MHVVFDESDNYMSKPVSDDLEYDYLIIVLHKNDLINIYANDSHAVKEPTVSADLPKEWKTPRDLTLDNVIGNIEKGVSTRKSLNNFFETMAFVPKNLEEALRDNNWILAMQEEMNQFALNEVWILVPRTSELNIIGTKWI